MLHRTRQLFIRYPLCQDPWHRASALAYGKASKISAAPIVYREHDKSSPGAARLIGFPNDARAWIAEVELLAC
jgi:hypothetical protein